MHPQSTFELTINFLPGEKKSELQTKEEVKSWLFAAGENTFVEGFVDGVDLDFDYENEDVDYYRDLGGDHVPLIIYRYDYEHLVHLNSRLCKEFGSSIKTALLELPTKNWMEGWKESFKPFSTQKFYVYPPWCSAPSDSAFIPIKVEPGMAFGTGQHATTQLCLGEIERLDFGNVSAALDVGTGTGILAIAMKLLGCRQLVATDIDPDAIIACQENAQANHQSFPIYQMSVPSEGQYDLVVANILFVVIQRILGELTDRVQVGGYLLISGVLEQESEEMNKLAVTRNLSLVRQTQHEGWVSLLYRRLSDS